MALALIARPQIVFLDELTQNLDPVGRRHTWEVVRQVRDSGVTVVLVTHDVEEAEQLCDRIALMDQGSIVAEGTPPALVEALGGEPVVRFTDPELDTRTLRDVPGAETVQRHGPEVHVTGSGPLLAHVGARLVDLGRPPLDLRIDHPSLEDRFIAHSQEAPPMTRSSPSQSRRRASRNGCGGRPGSPPSSSTSSCGNPASSWASWRSRPSPCSCWPGCSGRPRIPSSPVCGPASTTSSEYLAVVLANMGLVALPVHLASQQGLGVLRRYRGRAERGHPARQPRRAGATIRVASARSSCWPAGWCTGFPPDDPLAVIGWGLAGLACFVALGLALGTLMPSSRAANAIGNLVFVPMFLLGGGGPPRDVMTGPMQALSDVLPLSHIVGGLRHRGSGPPTTARLWWTVLVTVIAIAFAVRTARRRAV